jgi:hypothetical protein
MGRRVRSHTLNAEARPICNRHGRGPRSWHGWGEDPPAYPSRIVCGEIKVRRLCLCKICSTGKSDTICRPHCHPERSLCDPSMCNVRWCANLQTPLPIHPETLDAQCRGLDQSIIWNAFLFPSLEEIVTFSYNQRPLSQSSARIFGCSQVFRGGFLRLDLWCHALMDLQKNLRRRGQGWW